MSPLEAVHVATTMLQQKLLNPTYQMTDAERVAKRKMDPTRAPALTQEEAVQRSSEMHETVSKAINGNTVISLFQLTSDSKALLGIGQNGGN